MKLFSLWLKLLWNIHCPILIPLDLKHDIKIDGFDIYTYYTQMSHCAYQPEIHDCDNFAFEFKGIADKSTNTVGLVFGYMHGLHCWNCAITPNGLIQIEPQTGEVFRRKKEYFPIIVLI
jgi:hypothetical protein